MSIKERSKRILNLKEFENNTAPLNVGKMDLNCPFVEQKILRMAVRFEGNEFLIPDELNWVKPMFEKVLKFQRENIGIEHSFCYITIRHGLITSEKDDEWHLDGYSLRISHIPEQNYIWTSNHPTEYINKNIPIHKDLNPLIHNMNWYLEDFVNESDVLQCKEKEIYCIDPYILHRRPNIKDDIQRTFVRISFVPIEINDINNTQNPLCYRKYTKNGVEFRDKLEKFNP